MNDDPCASAAYALKALSEEDLPAILGLQHNVTADLKARGCEHFTIPKTQAQFAQFMQKPHLAVGAFVAGTNELAGMALVGFSGVNTEQRLRRGRVQTVLVHTAHQSQGLMGKLLGKVEEEARHDTVRTLLECNVADGNIGSESGFRKSGYGFVGRGSRDFDGTPLVQLEKILPARHPAQVAVMERSCAIGPARPHSAALMVSGL